MKVSASFLDQSTHWGGDHCWPSQVRREGKSPWTTIKETGVDNECPFQSQVRRLYGSPDGPQFQFQFSRSVALCNPIDCSTPGLPVHPPGAHPNSCPLSRWCHPAILSFIIPFSTCPQSFPASGSFQASQFFASSGHIIGVSVSTSVLPMNSQDWTALGWTGWISLQSKGLSRVFSNTMVQNINGS